MRLMYKGAVSWAVNAVAAAAAIAHRNVHTGCEVAHGVPCGPQYPQEARQEFARQYHEYKDARATLLDETRTARLLARSTGRRVANVYLADLKRAQRDMALERAFFWRIAKGV